MYYAIEQIIDSTFLCPVVILWCRRRLAQVESIWCTFFLKIEYVHLVYHGRLRIYWMRSPSRCRQEEGSIRAQRSSDQTPNHNLLIWIIQ